jgi:hypothetical protein
MTDEKPPKPIEEQLAEEITRVFKHFAPGGKFAPINDSAEYEKLRESLPPAERELNLAFTQFAQLLDYFERQNLKVGMDVANAISAAVRLPLEEQAGRIREINQALMKRIKDAGHGTPIRM